MPETPEPRNLNATIAGPIKAASNPHGLCQSCFLPVPKVGLNADGLGSCCSDATPMTRSTHDYQANHRKEF